MCIDVMQNNIVRCLLLFHRRVNDTRHILYSSVCVVLEDVMITTWLKVGKLLIMAIAPRAAGEMSRQLG